MSAPVPAKRPRASACSICSRGVPGCCDVCSPRCHGHFPLERHRALITALPDPESVASGCCRRAPACGRYLLQMDAYLSASRQNASSVTSPRSDRKVPANSGLGNTHYSLTPSVSLSSSNPCSSCFSSLFFTFLPFTYVASKFSVKSHLMRAGICVISDGFP